MKLSTKAISLFSGLFDRSTSFSRVEEWQGAPVSLDRPDLLVLGGALSEPGVEGDLIGTDGPESLAMPILVGVGGGCFALWISSRGHCDSSEI